MVGFSLTLESSLFPHSNNYLIHDILKSKECKLMLFMLLSGSPLSLIEPRQMEPSAV